MKRFARTLTLSLITSLAMLGANCAQAETQVKIGEKAPEFPMTGVDGKEHKLSDYLGKTVVLEWFNHDCPFVKKHYDPSVKNMQTLQKDATDDGVVWVSINSSALGKQGHLTAEQAIKITGEKGAHPSVILLDSNGKIGKLYGARTTPHMFVIDKAGILRYMGAIDSTASTEASDISASKNYVSQALAELKAGKPVSEPSTEAYGCSVKYGL
jgi:peroxiredoxin